MVVWETFDLAASFWVNAQTSVCREVACPLGTASETAREGKRLFSVRATSDIVRTWEKEVRNLGSGQFLWLLSCLLQESNKKKC